MKRKLIKLGSFVSIAALLAGQAAAASAYDFWDINESWAWDSIEWNVSNGLFTGLEDGSFAPYESMTRGMFVTVLGRLAGIDPQLYQNEALNCLFWDVSSESFYAPYVNWAVLNGVMRGIGGGMFCPDEPVTREQIATILVRYASVFNYEIIGYTDEDVWFSDQDSISDFARDSVETLRTTGLMNGKLTENGDIVFDPLANATREEGAAVLHRFAESLVYYEDREVISPESITVNPSDVAIMVGESTNLIYCVAPETATNQTVTWVSLNPDIATVDLDGVVTGVTAGTATIVGITANGLHASSTVNVTRPLSISYAGESTEEKMIRVFGETVSNYRNYYTSNEDALAHMETITIKVWDFADSSQTTKITKTFSLVVNENLADTVQAIFDEIYNGDEQFPIHSVGGYRYEPGSEHYSGLAIDINPMENYFVSSDGTPITGYLWDPENNPYSIPLEGDVAEAFARHGFTRGIYWRSGKKDYMHFSYFGT